MGEDWHLRRQHSTERQKLPIRRQGLAYRVAPRHRVTITGGGYGFRLDDLRHIVIDGFVIQESSNQGIYISNSDYITVENNEIRYIFRECLRFRWSRRGIARKNLIHHCAVTRTGRRTGGNGEGIYVGLSPTGRFANQTDEETGFIQLLDNEIHTTDDEPIEIKPGAYRVTIDGNHIHDSRFSNGAGIKLHATTTQSGVKLPRQNPRHVVRNNIIYNVSTTTRFSDGNCIAAGTGATIYNNVCYNAQHHGIRVDDWTGQRFPVRIYHNTIYGTGARALGIFRSERDRRRDHVIVVNNIGPTDPGNVVADANFFQRVGAPNAARWNLRLRRGAAPIDTASFLNFDVSRDIDGTRRPRGQFPDHGAYEYTGQ